jgi:hypothetical protein
MQESEFDEIRNQMRDGLTGKNMSISMGFRRLNKYIGIRKKILTLVFGPTGSGKSSFVNSGWILNTFDHYILDRNNPVKVKPILFSFERSKLYIKIKWLSAKIFKDTGKLISIDRILSWWDGNKITADEVDLILMYEDYVNELMEYVTVIEGASNPTGCYRMIKEQYAEKHGVMEQISERKKIYIPNNPNEIVVPIVDHIGLTRLEKGCPNKKAAVDKLTEYAQEWRDFYGYSPVFVAQITRELGSAQWQKLGDFEPTVDLIKESGAPGEAADLIISLFDPIRYNTADAGGYEAKKFINEETGEKPFRSVKILKNTYGPDGIRCGTVMNGHTGIFAELPKKNDVTDLTYEQVKNGSYYSIQDSIEQYLPKKTINLNKKME